MSKPYSLASLLVSVIPHYSSTPKPLLYIIYTLSNNLKFIQQLVSKLNFVLYLRELGNLDDFLDIEVKRPPNGSLT